nr:hypothetical protein [uncultured bacterium]
MGALACKTKIIIDGNNVGGYAEALCEATSALSNDQVDKLTDDVAYPIIKEVIKAEKAMQKAHNMLLDAVGYDGPRP